MHACHKAVGLSCEKIGKTFHILLTVGWSESTEAWQYCWLRLKIAGADKAWAEAGMWVASGEAGLGMYGVREV